MARIQFKAKIRNNGGDFIQVPVFTTRHCDMAAFRKHAKYGAYANSDLFPGMLARIRNNQFPKGRIWLDNIPSGVVVDTSGFLAVVALEV